MSAGTAATTAEKVSLFSFCACLGVYLRGVLYELILCFKKRRRVLGAGEERAQPDASLDEHSTQTARPPAAATAPRAPAPPARPPRDSAGPAGLRRAFKPRTAPHADPTWRLGPAGRPRLLEAEREESGYRGRARPAPPATAAPPAQRRPPHLRRGRLGDQQRQPPSGPPVELMDLPVEHPLPHCQHDRHR